MSVSVVIPAYQAEQTLRAAVQSVLEQTSPPIEVIVVDDGSTDGTADIARGFGDPVTTVSIPNGGVSAARNTGAGRASGDLIAFLDADDRWLPRKLEAQVAALEGSPDQASFTAAFRVSSGETDGPITPAHRPHDWTKALLLHSMVVTAFSSSILVDRRLLATVGGFDPRFSQCADWDCALRLSLVTGFEPVDEPLVEYRVSAGQMSADIGLLERDTMAVLDDFFAHERPADLVALRRRAYSNHWMILAGSYLQAGSRRDALRCLLAGLRANPANVGRPLGLPARRLRRRLA